MPVQKIIVSEFLAKAKDSLIIDVRSPSEFEHAHIPNAINISLFDDEQRKIVGTAYKQQSKEEAIKIGLDYFGPKMKEIIESVETYLKNNNNKSKTLFVHCWRGGMRSAGVAWLLDLYGFTVYTLIGGYKAYRNFVTEQFKKEYNFKIIGGYTGSGKTYILNGLQENAHAIIDLEHLANHKGSALGGIGMPKPPSQEMFENLLANELYRFESNTTIFLEDESQRIGNLILPNTLWDNMRNSKVFFLDIPFEERLIFLTTEYGKLEIKELVNAAIRIKKRLGGLETKNCINYLLENNFKEAFGILLKYYDKHYLKGLHNRNADKNLITIIQTEKVSTKENLELLKKYL